MIRVTQSYLPPIEEYTDLLNSAWENKWITNRGDLLKELEEKLKTYLKVPNITLTTNGTLPIQIAIKALKLNGEIITTPFSYVASTSSIVWENCKPVFVDIDEKYLTIDTSKIEAAITSKTVAILAVHVFGNPCDVEKIEKIAAKHNLKVIYDAAHCFGVKYKGQSIFNYGDVSTCSFHATKIFHTGEGGCFISNDKFTHEELFYGHNFGHKTPTSFHNVGINAKMSELQAAMGLAVFNHIDEIFSERKRVVDKYNELLNSSKLKTICIRDNTDWNYHYYPIVFETEEQLLITLETLNNEDIYPRRYFYPSLNTLDYVKYSSCPISESISSRVLCLPLYTTLEDQDINKIVNLILKSLN